MADYNSSNSSDRKEAKRQERGEKKFVRQNEPKVKSGDDRWQRLTRAAERALAEEQGSRPTAAQRGQIRSDEAQRLAAGQSTHREWEARKRDDLRRRADHDPEAKARLGEIEGEFLESQRGSALKGRRQVREMRPQPPFVVDRVEGKYAIVRDALGQESQWLLDGSGEIVGQRSGTLGGRGRPIREGDTLEEVPLDWGAHTPTWK